MPGILRARNCRQRKAGVCGRYSYRDFVPRDGDQAWRSVQAAGVAAGIFMSLAVAVFPGMSSNDQKGAAAMTDQLAAGYAGTEPFPGGSPPHTFEGAVRRL
jgi:hypothetical protein